MFAAISCLYEIYANRRWICVSRFIFTCAHGNITQATLFQRSLAAHDIVFHEFCFRCNIVRSSQTHTKCNHLFALLRKFSSFANIKNKMSSLARNVESTTTKIRTNERTYDIQRYLLRLAAFCCWSCCCCNIILIKENKTRGKCQDIKKSNFNDFHLRENKTAICTTNEWNEWIKRREEKNAQNRIGRKTFWKVDKNMRHTENVMHTNKQTKKMCKFIW